MRNMKKITILLAALLLAALPFAGCKAAAKNVDIMEVFEAVKNEMGDGYTADRTLAEQDFKDMFGIAPDDMESSFGQISAMSMSLDFFIAVKAKPGKADAVEKALQDWRTGQIDAGVLYPFQMAKMKASQLVRHGDYVFLLVAGTQYAGDDPSEENLYEFAKTENQKAVDVVNQMFA
jgi:hypothetical protein